MENTKNMTMGKRIYYYRKCMGLTQEQLAERVGVTAQAVSKWEHDLAVPDVGTLPRLGEIFGVSMDELMGLKETQSQPAKEVIVDGIEEKKRIPWSWNWTLRSQGWGNWLIAGFLIVLGGLLLASHLLEWDVDFGQIFWPLGLMYVGLNFSRHITVFGSCCVLAGLYFLLCNLGVIAVPFLTWPVVLACLLVACGLGLLFRRKPTEKKGYRVHINNSFTREKPQREYRCTDGQFHADYAFCSERINVVEPMFRGGHVDVGFGSMVLDLSGCEDIAPDCCIDFDVAFSSLTLTVPRRFCILEGDIDKTGCSTAVKGQPLPDAKPIRLDGECNFGSLTIQYI